MIMTSALRPALCGDDPSGHGEWEMANVGDAFGGLRLEMTYDNWPGLDATVYDLASGELLGGCSVDRIFGERNVTCATERR